METIFIYFAKVNIALVGLYLLYVLLFRQDTFIKIRRYYFISVIFFSLAYPMFTVTALGNLVDLQTPKAQIEPTVLIGDMSMEAMIIDDLQPAPTPISWLMIMKWTLLSGSFFFAIRFVWQLCSIIRIKMRSEKETRLGYTLYHLWDEITPFSFFNWIFIHTETHTDEELKQILLHEQTHVRQWHSLDIMLIELLRIVFWWNPIVWLMKRDIAINLEYLADKAVLQKGVKNSEYQYHLLQLTYQETAVQIVNNFNVSQLKKRIIMMNTNKSPMRKLAKYLSVIPLAILLITANSMYANTNETQQDPVKIENKDSKEKPKYYEVTKNLDKLADILKSEIKYPQIAKENGIQGDVIASFIIEEDGSIINPKIEVGVFPSLNQEAIRVINTMPKLKQFTYIVDDEPLRIKYNGHFAFHLDGKKTSFDVAIRGYTVLTIADKTGNDKPLFIVDGVKMGKEFDMNSLKRSDIENTIIYQKEAAIATYGEEGKNGAVIITTKDDSTKDATHQTLAEKFGKDKPLIIIDDVKMNKDFELNKIESKDIESISVLKNESAISKYGDAGKNGVIIITTKASKNAKKDVTTNRDKAPNDVFVVVEKQPEFPGGTSEMMKFLSENIKYPVEAKEKGIDGRVIVNFIVNKDGSISDPNVVRGANPLLDAEALRVISMMPKWKPGEQRGQHVNVRFTLPIVFRLPKEDNAKSESMSKLEEKGPVKVYEEKTDAPDKGFYKFIAETIKYPVIAQENGIMGLARATYDINGTGEISNVKITEGTDPSLDAELIRVIKLMPKDIALLNSGGKAASNVEISALFRLQDEGTVPPPPVKSDIVVVGYGKPAEKK